MVIYTRNVEISPGGLKEERTFLAWMIIALAFITAKAYKERIDGLRMRKRNIILSQFGREY